VILISSVKFELADTSSANNKTGAVVSTIIFEVSEYGRVNQLKAFIALSVNTKPVISKVQLCHTETV
jgi:hypothetical protein